ncbi:nucleotide exchange factor GrpE [Nitrococcus mobilis]|uniref:Protein GrpE n=1 Tax=Nitrococcus mobilis Nb-231 TaxID=314278 RepID=A4BRX4_9GAMM|nr:nucleotide exchange factor GrpE [Nitrococcus mobilis]EAR21453.1 GrpE protein [Nitrococcus mobilis Nb-231]
MAEEERNEAQRNDEPSAQAHSELDAQGNESIERLQQAVERLTVECESARTRAEENWNQFLRARAELENQHRRSQRDVEQAHRYALEKLANELLGVRDSLEMGVSVAQEAHGDVSKLREGVELTLKMLNQVMEKFDIHEVNPQGERFDPEKHEAMAAQESAEHDPNTVIHVVQKGYLLNDRLLRPALVIVSKPDNHRPSGGAIDEQA